MACPLQMHSPRQRMQKKEWAENAGGDDESSKEGGPRLRVAFDVVGVHGRCPAIPRKPAERVGSSGLFHKNHIILDSSSTILWNSWETPSAPGVNHSE